MADLLNLFPQRAAIGRVDARGNVYMTDEFTRALAVLSVRVGGPSGASTADLDVAAAHASAVQYGHVLEQAAADLQRQVVELAGQFALLAEVRKGLAELERAAVEVQMPTDWEHPGKIGAGTANSGKFTTLEATSQVTLNPANQPVDIKPTGTGLLTIQPAAVGQVDNMELGRTAPQAARVTTLNKLTLTQPATGATLTLADGKTLTVSATLTLTGNDGASLNIGAGGTLGSAAFQNSGAFAARSGTALAPAATDPASTQALANSLRSVLLSVGIGS